MLGCAVNNISSHVVQHSMWHIRMNEWTVLNKWSIPFSSRTIFLLSSTAVTIFVLQHNCKKYITAWEEHLQFFSRSIGSHKTDFPEHFVAGNIFLWCFDVRTLFCELPFGWWWLWSFEKFKNLYVVVWMNTWEILILLLLGYQRIIMLELMWSRNRWISLLSLFGRRRIMCNFHLENHDVWIPSCFVDWSHISWKLEMDVSWSFCYSLLLVVQQTPISANENLWEENSMMLLMMRYWNEGKRRWDQSIRWEGERIIGGWSSS